MRVGEHNVRQDPALIRMAPWWIVVIDKFRIQAELWRDDLELLLQHGCAIFGVEFRQGIGALLGRNGLFCFDSISCGLCLESEINPLSN